MIYFSERSDPKLFACPCGNCDAKPSAEMLWVADAVRQRAKVPMVINSGPRCAEYNAKIGGAEHSEHVDGDGIDVACTSSRARYLLINAALAEGVTRIGVGKNFIHLGVSETNDPCVIWVY